MSLSEHAYYEGIRCRHIGTPIIRGLPLSFWVVKHRSCDRWPVLHYLEQGVAAAKISIKETASPLDWRVTTATESSGYQCH